MLRRALGLATPLVRSEIPVLTYHSIDDTGSLISIDEPRFRAQLVALRDDGWRSLTIAEYGALAEAGRVEPRTVLITFDDGYRNFAERAAPALRDHGLTATVFVAADHVGRHPLWLGRDQSRTAQLLDLVRMTSAERATLLAVTDTLQRDPLMDWPDLRDLVSAGFDVQSHSAAHEFLTCLAPAALVADLRRSRTVLEDRLGCPVPAIAYPYGEADAAVAAVAQEAGFTIGFIADHGLRETRRVMEWRAGIGGDMIPGEVVSMLRSWPLYPRVRAWLRGLGDAR